MSKDELRKAAEAAFSQPA
jgi:hypothetical protein